MRAPPLTLKRAKDLRRAMTEPEVMLWSRLRKRHSGSPPFRRQHPVGPYILDFYCTAAHLAVEIDGHGHGEPAQRQHDARRDIWLGARGVRVHRITASSVYEDVDDVADGLRRLADDLAGRTHGA